MSRVQRRRWPTTCCEPRAGLYRDPLSGALLEIVLGKDGLHLQRETGPRLLPLDGMRFATAGRAEYVFEPAAGGTARLVETPGHTHPTTWVKVDRVAPSADALAEYVGRYTSAELEVSYRLSLQNGKLVMRHHGDTPRPLEPADQDAFISPDGVVRFTRDASEPDRRLHGVSRPGLAPALRPRDRSDGIGAALT